MKKKVLILGSTGSIGCHSLQVLAQHTKRFQVDTLTARHNVKLLAEQAISFGASNVLITDESKLMELRNLLKGTEINIYVPNDNFFKGDVNYDITIVGIDGIAALKVICDILAKTKILALANKESIVCSGEFIIAEARKHSTKIIPLDSEHNAIWQVFEEHNRQNIEKIILTASGGPFLKRKIEDLRSVKTSEAVQHPRWKMGRKISVDSANMVNKGLEIMEACLLFDLPMAKVEAVIHPQSIMHGMVYYNDGSILAHLANHDMQIPISTCLNYPQRTPCLHRNVDLIKIGSLQFQEITLERFPLFFLAKQAFGGGIATRIIFNIANERAVAAFIKERISFLSIDKVFAHSLEKISNQKIDSISDVYKFIDIVHIRTEEFISSL